MAKAVVLYSGGLDSTTALFWAQVEGYELVPLTLLYGQTHDLNPGSVAVKAVCERLRIEEHYVVQLPDIGHSPLTGYGDIPKDADPARPGVAETYVPGRNLILLSWANSLAEEIGARVIVGGFNAVDYSGYPDCRDRFLQAFADVATLARGINPRDTENRVEVLAPFVAWSKRRIVEWGHAHGVPYDFTSSCYEPWKDGSACGRCDACQIRWRAFEAAGLQDPFPYHEEPSREPA